MSEPLDPIAAGVASALKSLRARAGLREDRLAGNELALDTLAGLSSVRALMAAGDTREHAIVRAITTAVSALEPTYSIVADVSLGLGLSRNVMPGSDLYAEGLGKRRAALLENWGRLHELRSVASPRRAPAPRTLRLEIETAAFSALAAALTQAARQPESRDLPGAEVPADAKPDLPGDRAAPGRPGARPDLRVVPGRSPRSGSSVADRPASADRDIQTAAPPLLGRTQVPLLITEFRRIANALRGALIEVDGRRGWPHDLRPGSTPATAFSTSYGIKAMLLLEGFLAPDLKKVAQWLKNSASEGGGYAARTQKEPRPEVTAAVLNALHRIDGTDNFEAQISLLKNDLGDFEKRRPFILTTILETSVQLGTDRQLTRTVIKDLLATRRPYGNIQLWPQKAEETLVAPAPSIAHTARAVWALTQALGPRSAAQPLDALHAEAQEAADQAAAWLSEQGVLENVSELTDRQLPSGGVEPVYVRHFTAAWVVKALVSVGLPASHPSVSGAVARIWDDYNEETALWRWSNGELPVWMTLDAVEALHLAALAATLRSGGSGALR
jgi:hypothetical protein